MTYNPNLSEPKDKVRFLLGDTTSPYTLSNEEINAVLADNNNDEYAAAIACCNALIARYTKKSTSAGVGPFSINYSETADQYRNLLVTLEREQNRRKPPVPAAFGYQDKEHRPQDEDTDDLIAEKGMHDFYGGYELYEGGRDPYGFPA